MGQLHNELTRGLFSSALTAALGVAKGRGGLERFGETLQPIVNLWERPEWAFLRQEQLWAVRQSQGAVALEFGHIAIANPANSGVISVVEVYQARSSTAGTSLDTSIFYEGTWTSSTARATMALQANGVRALDTRVRPSGIVRTEIWSGTDPASQGGAQAIDNDIAVVANDWRTLIMVPVVLVPDSAVIVIGGTVNVVVAMRARGYERAILNGEL